MPQRRPSPTVASPRAQSGSATAASAQHQSEALDEALAESFPASDSIAIDISRVEPPESAARNKLPDGRIRDNIEQ